MSDSSLVSPTSHGGANLALSPWENGIRPDWPVHPRVRAFTTVRAGGVSDGAHGLAGAVAGGLNLGSACGDSPQAVAENRRRLRECLPDEPIWLQQVHGTRVWLPDVAAAAASEDGQTPVADAAVSGRPGRVLVVMTADCLPVFFADQEGEFIGVAHAGWRGLASGVLENTLQALRDTAPAQRRWHAWLGPAIGPTAFEVGDDVFDAFVGQDAATRPAFRPTGQAGKWWADLYALARHRLQRAGVATVGACGACTVSDPHRFYSYRRDRQTGRMASLIWIDANVDRPDRQACQSTI